jgi:integrase
LRWIAAVFDFAKARHWRSGENPAAWRGNIALALPAPSKVKPGVPHAAAPFNETPALIADLLTQDSVGALCLSYTISTCARSGEARGATWREIDLNEATWTIPAERMKTRRPHRVPLSPLALDILRRMHPGDAPDAIVFPGLKHRPLTDTALKSVLRRMKRVDLTVHGFRSTFRDWAGETTNYPRGVIEMALAHQIGDATERAYARGDLFRRRRKLMNDWGAYCEGKAVADADVVPLRA